MVKNNWMIKLEFVRWIYKYSKWILIWIQCRLTSTGSTGCMIRWRRSIHQYLGLPGLFLNVLLWRAEDTSYSLQPLNRKRKENLFCAYTLVPLPTLSEYHDLTHCSKYALTKFMQEMIFWNTVISNVLYQIKFMMGVVNLQNSPMKQLIAHYNHLISPSV